MAVNKLLIQPFPVLILIMLANTQTVNAQAVKVHPYYLSNPTHANRSVGHAFGAYVKPCKDGCFYSISRSFGVVNLARNQWSHSAGIRWSISAEYPVLETFLAEWTGHEFYS